MIFRKNEYSALDAAIEAAQQFWAEIICNTRVKIEEQPRRLRADRYLENECGLGDLISSLFSLGVDLSSQLFADISPASVDALPLYPFQLERYWMVLGDAEELAKQVTQRRLSPSNA